MRELHPRTTKRAYVARFNEAAGVDPADASNWEVSGRLTATGGFNEAAGVDPADATPLPIVTDQHHGVEPASMRPRG